MIHGQSSCGKHTTLANNEGASVTQCPCGTMHVLVKGSGVTVQLPPERFHQLGLAVMGAVSALGAKNPTTTFGGAGTRTMN